MTPREKDIYIFIGFLILVLFASIGMLCTCIHIYRWCKYECCRKEVVFIRNNNENINPIV